jgi:hypothetical protein
VLTFTHTYLLDLAFRMIHGRGLGEEQAEIILGDVIPDFVTHLGREEYQRIAHDLHRYESMEGVGLLEQGALYHVLIDNVTTLGCATYEGSYPLERCGFVERLALQVVTDLPPEVPRRRFLQAAMDILVLNDCRDRLWRQIVWANEYLAANYESVLEECSHMYGISPQQLEIGIGRFLRIFSKEGIRITGLQEYRLYPIARTVAGLKYSSEPEVILAAIRARPEIMEAVQSNMELIESCWQELLWDTCERVLEHEVIREAIASW